MIRFYPNDISFFSLVFTVWLLLAVFAVRMSASDEMMKTLHNIWSKLQGLTQDHPLMQGAFVIIILFFCKHTPSF